MNTTLPTAPRIAAPLRAWPLVLRRHTKALLAALIIAYGSFSTSVELHAAQFDLSTVTIADLNAGFKAGTLTSEKLVQLYLARIAAYDKQGPALNTVITPNPKALDEAKALDAERKAKGPRSPIHGVPIILKDNFDTFDLPTSVGCFLLKGSIPADDAFVVKKLRDAGAIILAKVNTTEFAGGGGGTDPLGYSTAGGQTRNAYDPLRIPGGSSGGTGSGIAATFAQFGLGTDTGGSIRNPCSFNGLAGLKPTHGLLSRDGIAPLALTFDTGGPMARSVYDVAVSLGVMTGVDKADAATKKSAGKFETDYTQYLKTGSLKGARIGVARDFFGHDAETDRVMEASIATLKKLGATVIDVRYPEYFMASRRAISSTISPAEFKSQIGDYLRTLKPAYPKSLTELVAKAFDPAVGYPSTIKHDALKKTDDTALALTDPVYLSTQKDGLAMITANVLALFTKHKLDAMVYPTWPKPATLITEPYENIGLAISATNIANQTGFPDLIVPAGFTKSGLPVTISFFGPAFSEPKLLSYGYDFEQATKAYVLPKTTPSLPGDTLTL
jgi:amidase